MGEINIDVARRNPSGAVAAVKGNATPVEVRQIEQWTYLRDLDKKFRKMQPDKATKEFRTLDPSVQEVMRGVFGKDGYLEPEISLGRRIASGIVRGATTPIRLALDAANIYNRAINVGGLQVAQAVVGEEKPDLGKILSRKNFDASWDGKALYNYDALEKVESQYDEATAFVAKQMLMGRRPGEIIEARGELDNNFVNALNSALNEPEKFASILDDFERAKLSPGRDVARKLFGNKKGSQRVVDPAFTAVSGFVDAIYQIAIDPLTYATFGTGTALTKGARLAEIVRNAGASDIAKVFADPQVRKLWDSVGPQLEELAQARKAGDVTKAGSVRRSIAELHPAIDNDEVIKLLAESNVKDANTAEMFFGQVENFQYLASGRVDNATFVRDGVAYAHRTQNLRQWFNTQLKAISQGKIQEVDASKFKDATEGIRELGGRIDTIPTLSPRMKEMIAKEDTFIKRARRIVSRHPGSQAIAWTDEHVESTLPQVRALSRMLGFDKNFAYAFGEYFARSTESERIELIRGLYSGIMQKQGADPTFIRKVMDEKFAATRNFGTTGEVVHGTFAQNALKANPAFTNNPPATTVSGALHFSQGTKMVGALPFDELMAHIAAQKGKSIKISEPIKFMGGGIQSIVQSKFVTNITSVWNFFNLAPRLGMRNTIEETFMGYITRTNQELKSFLHGRALRNVQTAFTGELSAVGPVKNVAQKLMGKGAYAIPDAARIELDDLSKKIAYSGNNPQKLKEQNAAIITLEKKYGLTAAALTEHNAVTYLANYAMKLYGGRLPKEIQDIKLQHMLNNSYHFDANVNSITARTANGTVSRIDIVGNPVTPTSYDAMLKAEGIEFTKNFKTVTRQQVEALGSRQWPAVWFKNAVVRLNGNTMVFNKDESLNLGKVFFDNNALKTEADFNNALYNIMRASGFELQGQMWVVKDAVKAKKATQWTADTTEKLTNPALDLANIYYVQTVNRLQDMFHAFHGNPERYNEALFNHVKKTAGKDGMVKAFVDMDFDEYEKLTKGFLDSPTVNTELLIPNIDGNDTAAWIAATGNKVFEAMDRQVTGMYRSPAFESSAAISGLKWRPAQEKYRNNLINQGYDPEVATRIAARTFTEIATREAANRVLKYVDNPEIRSQLAHSAKNIGRYYRATEDYVRRVFRLKDTKWTTLYRMRLAQIGLEGSGLMYTDPEGERYMLFPGDNILYNTFDSVLTALYGENKFMKSGQYNEFTMKFSLANPALQEDAARPTLSGPLAAVTVIGMRNILGLIGNDDMDKWTEDIDELFLGPMAKDATLQEATMPSVIRNMWRVMSPAERERQLTSAGMSAIAYLFDVNKPLQPDASPQEKEDFLKAVRVTTTNVLYLRSFLGIFFPVTPTVQESKQIPEYIKQLGITSLSAEYQSILNGVFKIQARDEDFDADPFEMALKIFTEKNPGKLIYSISRSEKTTRSLITQNEQVKNWIIGNRSLINKYGTDAALMFAPQMGEYERSAGKWFRQQGLTESLELDQFLERAQIAELKNEYFRLGDEKTERLKNTVSETERRAIANYYEGKRKQMKDASPMLVNALELPSPADELEIYKSIRAIAADEQFPINKLTRARLQQMVNVFERAYVELSSTASPNAVDFVDYKADVRRAAQQQLEELAGNDEQLQLVLRRVFSPVMRFYSRDIVSIKPSR